MSESYSTSNQALEALAALNQAALAIANELALDKVLQLIVESARGLAGAQYAALGVPDEEGFLAEFVFSGMPPEEAAKLPHLPGGLGLLGAIIHEGWAIRIPKISDDPRSVGFPPGHPPMDSFLGVPVVAGDVVLGNLYLTNKTGANEFTQADEELIKVFAAHAAVAIKNARLFQARAEREQELQVRSQELYALNVVARAISRYLDLDHVLSEALDQVLGVTGAEAGEVFLLEESTGDVTLALHRGPHSEAFRSITRFRPGDGFIGKVAQTGVAVATTDLPGQQDYRRRAVVEAGFRSYVCLPLTFKNKVVGVMGLATQAIRVFGESDLALLEAIGSQIGVAVENARLYSQVGRLAIVEERSRIGMDLHDGVIQSIYAVGLTLESVRLLLPSSPDEADKLLSPAIAALNAVIRDIRNFILDLRPQRFEKDLAQGLARLVREFQANAMVPVTLEAPEEVVAMIPTQMARAIFLTTQEALANIARHARATSARVAVRRDDHIVQLTIEDNGRGFDASEQGQSVGHGLHNMKSRAQEMGGSFDLQTSPGEGVRLTVTLPLGKA